MKIVSEQNIDEIASVLNSGGIVVLRTDTIYGIVACADDKRACDTIFAVKQRDASKACIVLIADSTQVWDEVSTKALDTMSERTNDSYPTSLIVPVADKTPTWIHHGNQDVAFRIPHTKPWLVSVVQATGPIIAPSANLQGHEPARSINEAFEYFGSAVDLYVDGGEVAFSEPSHLYRLTNGELERLR